MQIVAQKNGSEDSILSFFISQFMVINPLTKNASLLRKFYFPIKSQTTALIFLAVSGLGAAVLDMKLRSGCFIPRALVSLYFVRNISI